MLAPGLKQVQIIGKSTAGQLFCRVALGGENLRGRSVCHIDRVYIVNQLHNPGRLHKVGKPAAERSGKIKLSIGERPSPAESAHSMAYRTADAFFHLSGHNGAAAVINVRALVQGQHLQLRVQMGQLIGGKNARLPAAQDDNVVSVAHGCSFLPDRSGRDGTEGRPLRRDACLGNSLRRFFQYSTLTNKRQRSAGKGLNIGQNCVTIKAATASLKIITTG